MNKIINYLKSISLFLILFLIYLLIISLIYYLEILSYNTVSIINYIVILLLFFVLGFKTSSLERSKGYLNGFIVSTSICILFSIITLFISKYSFGTLVYYLSLIFSVFYFINNICLAIELKKVSIKYFFFSIPYLLFNVYFLSLLIFKL